MVRFTRRFIFIGLLFILSSAVQAGQHYSNIYIFGDSLSDTGNLASILGDFPFPYYNNRISNGPVAVDTLAAGIGHIANPSLHLVGPADGTNYAVVGARAAGNEAIDLATQTQAFLLNHGQMAPADALYVVMIGGNDVRDTVAPGAIDSRQLLNNAVIATTENINLLITHGARHFLVINVPDLGALPETRILAQLTGDARLPARASRLSKRYNRKLTLALKTLRRQSDAAIVEFDLFSFGRLVIDNAELFGYTNTTDACFSSISLEFHPDCDFGANFNQFVFFDEIHPTAQFHSQLGNLLIQTVP